MYTFSATSEQTNTQTKISLYEMTTSNSETKPMQQHTFHHQRSRTDGEPVKFLCSHGGNILLHPADGRLKYTGGDTRVISVHRHITLHELMKKVSSMFNGEMILKYQLTPEDYEVLVTVKSDEDVRHMIDECDRLEHVGGPRLRAFLFPSNPIVMVNHLETTDRHSLEQQYVNSINGIVVQPSPVIVPLPINTTPAATNCSTNIESATCHGRPSSLTRTRSSPSLYNQVANASSNLSQNHHHHHQQPPKPQPQAHTHHFHQQPYHAPKPPLDRHPHKSGGSEHLGMMRSPGAAEYYSGTNRGGQMHHQRGPPYDDYYDGECGYDGTDSPNPDVSSSSHSMRSGR